MSDTSSSVAAVNPDPMATADNLFVSGTEAQVDAAVDVGASGTQEVMKVTDLQGKKFALRANHQDMELTPEELLSAAQKGLGFDDLTTKHGQLKQQLEPAANNWKAFEEAMNTNPGAALAAYAQQHGMTVGVVNKEGYFEQVDPAAGPTGQPQSSSPEVQALSTEVNELKDILTQLVGGLASTQEEQQLMQQHNATAEEVKAAQKVAIERSLPPGSLDIALAMVRQVNPQTPEGVVPAVQTPGSGPSDTETILQLLKAGNPMLTGGGPGAMPVAGTTYSDMTPLQRTKSAWEEAKKEAGIASVQSTT